MVGHGRQLPQIKTQGPKALASGPTKYYKLSEAMLHELIVFPPLSNTAEYYFSKTQTFWLEGLTLSYFSQSREPL